MSIAGATPTTVALKPFTIVKTVAGKAIPSSLPESVQVSTAQLLFAPLGGTDATGAAVDPGATLAFDASVAGKNVHLDGGISGVL